jgi:predicted nuclease with TOPRIM domain
MSGSPKDSYILEDIQELKKDVKDLLQRDVADKQSIDCLQDSMKETNTILKEHTGILRENTAQLAEHIRRTNALEGMVKNLSDRVEPIEQDFREHHIIRKFLKSKIVIAAAILAAMGGIIDAAMKIIEVIK